MPKLSELKNWGHAENTLLQFEFLLVQTCLAASQLSQLEYFVYFLSLYDSPFLKKDDYFYLLAKNAELNLFYQKSKTLLKVALSVNPLHFESHLLQVRLFLRGDGAATSDEASYSLELLLKINPSPEVHGLMSMFLGHKNIEKSIFHSQTSLAGFFEFCPFNLELICFSRD